MPVTIQNEALTVRISEPGAELASVRDAAGTEYLWQGDPAIWPRRAPLLFPVIARLKDSSYLLRGEKWTIPTHGFCRAAPFQVTEQAADRVSFRYAATAETKKSYPFSFVLTVTYSLEGTSLRKSHLVENRGPEPMYYELGGHDGYRAPLSPGETMGEYGIRFPGLAEARPYGMDGDNMLTPKGRSFPLPEGRLSLKPSDYGLDTVILDELPRRQAILEDGQGNPRVVVEFDDFPYVGIWTAAKEFDTNYVCIEPWTSLPDGTFVGRELSEKAGIRVLGPGERETLAYTAAFLPAPGRP